MEVKNYLLRESKFKLEDFKETILKLEDNNDNMALRLLYAKLVGEKRLEEVMKSINNIVDFEHGSGDIKDYIYKKEKSLHELGRKKYGKQYWDENIYNPRAVNESNKGKYLSPNYNYDEIINPLKYKGIVLKKGDEIELDQTITEMPLEKAEELELIYKEKRGILSNTFYRREKFRIKYKILEVKEEEKYPLIDAEPAMEILYRVGQIKMLNQRNLINKNYKKV